MNEKDHKAYKNIFATTLLFGFVHIFKIAIAVIKNKLVAILLGTDGVGLLGIYNSALQLLQTGAGLGVNQSAVRDISEACGSQDQGKIAKLIAVTNRMILFTGLLGITVTAVCAEQLSTWLLGSRSFYIPCLFLGIAVCFQIMAQGKLAILQGTRQLKSLAWANVIGITAGAVTAIPLYYFWGKEGIMPELIIAGLVYWLCCSYFTWKIDVSVVRITWHQTFQIGGPMLKMGTAMMAVAMLRSLVALLLSAYIRAQSDFSQVGIYMAGVTILNSYFSIIVTSMSTDYYPRIAMVNKDNAKLQQELNRQIAVCLVICCPLFVFFVFLIPQFIRLLYTASFLPATDFLQYAIYGTLIMLSSNQIDLILVAKFRIVLFSFIAIFLRLVELGTSILLYKYFGLAGLGMATVVLGVIHMILMIIIMYKDYRIVLSRFVWKTAIVILGLVIGASLGAKVSEPLLKFSLGGVLFLISLWFSYTISYKHFGINFIEFIKQKLCRQ